MPSTAADRIQDDPRYGSWPARLPEANAAFLVHAWPDLERSVEHLSQMNEAYSKLLTDLGAVPQTLLKDTKGAWIFAPFRLPPRPWHTKVNRLSELLAEAGIATRRAFTPQRTLFGTQPSSPISAKLYEEILCLPTGPSMPTDQVDAVVEGLYKAMQTSRIT